MAERRVKKRGVGWDTSSLARGRCSSAAAPVEGTCEGAARELVAVEVLVMVVLEVVVVGPSVDDDVTSLVDEDISLVDEGMVELGPDVAETVLLLSVVVELVVVELVVAELVVAVVLSVGDSEAVEVTDSVVSEGVVVSCEDVVVEVLVTVEEVSVVLAGGLVLELVSVLLDSVGSGTALTEVRVPPEVVDRCVEPVPMLSGELFVGAGSASVASQNPRICSNLGLM